MKICIITCHTPMNYGAMLQAFALQNYLEQQSCSVEIIDYSPDIMVEQFKYSYVGDERYKRNFLTRIAYLIYKFPSRIKRKRNFQHFKNEYLHITTRYKSFESLYINPPVADQYICGSDQIWNTKGTRGFNPVFYLGFVKDIKKRNSYAASMAIDFPINQRVKGDVLHLIENMDMVSIRDSETIKNLQPYLNKCIEHVLDPVFLLCQNEWKGILSNANPINEKYILVYKMSNSNSTIDNANLLSKKTSLPIYVICSSDKKINGVKKLEPSVCDFLWLFMNAEYVITDSFHGTSFSIIFRKNFWSCQVNSNNHRITSILNTFNLGSRYISRESLIELSDLEIDYSKSEDLIEKHINQSKEFLFKIINK